MSRNLIHLQTRVRSRNGDAESREEGQGRKKSRAARFNLNSQAARRARNELAGEISRVRADDTGRGDAPVPAARAGRLQFSTLKKTHPFPPPAPRHDGGGWRWKTSRAGAGGGDTAGHFSKCRTFTRMRISNQSESAARRERARVSLLLLTR